MRHGIPQGFFLLACLLLATATFGQVLDKAVLNSTVWITYEVAAPVEASAPATAGKPARPAPPPSSFGGTGFLLFQGMGYTKGQVYLVTNKHVLPPEGKPQDIRVRVAVHDKNGVAK